jgi:hypothetical protein
MNWHHRFALEGCGISFVPNPLILVNIVFATKLNKFQLLTVTWIYLYGSQGECRLAKKSQLEHLSIIIS